MVYRNTTIGGIPTPSTKQGGGGAPSQGGWAPATQGPMSQLLITLILANSIDFYLWQHQVEM